MIFICAQPATLFYAWNVEVMLDSLLRNEIDPNNIHIVCSVGDDFYAGWEKLKEKYSNVSFFFYEDTRNGHNDVFSIRPNLLKQHWEEHPHLKNESIFYTDCDIILTKKIDWNQFIEDDVWYGSDCGDYVSADPIIDRGEDLLERICSIANIDKEIIKSNRSNTIGAHYILKNIDSNFWESVELDTINLFNGVSAINSEKEKESESYSKIPIYGDMWAILWNGWKLGRRTECHRDFSFCWAPRGKVSFDSHNIFHNAGIQYDMRNEYFYKYNYINKLPYFDNLEIRTDTASYEYWQEVKRTGENTVLF